MSKIEELLAQEGVLLADGATGTQMFKLGLTDGAPPEYWNESVPENVTLVHGQYIGAGAQIILTNTFGGTTYRLKLHDLQERSYDLNKRAAELARKAADLSDDEVIVAGSMGPTGEILEPMGQMKYEDAVASFKIQAQGLHDGGADAFWIETLSDLNEVRAAIDAIRQVSDRPICACMTFDTKGRTMMGVTPQQAARMMTDLEVFAFGANCGNGIDEIEAVVAQMREVAPNARLIAKSNAGIPQWINNALVYDGTPEDMAEYAQRVRTLGANIIGGCCGTSPNHVKAMRNALDADPLVEVVDVRGHMIDEKAIENSASPPRRRRRKG